MPHVYPFILAPSPASDADASRVTGANLGLPNGATAAASGAGCEMTATVGRPPGIAALAPATPTMKFLLAVAVRPSESNTRTCTV